jgi:hypothetical protein
MKRVVKPRPTSHLDRDGAPWMICPPLSSSRLVENWIERHRNPVSFVLHMIGIPPTILGVLLIPIYVYCLSVPIFLLALALFVGGYLVQFLGHAFEGTDPGEVIYFKRKFGLSYVDIAPPRRSRRGVA